MEIAVETPAFLQPVSPGASMRAPRRFFAKSTTGYYFITPPVSLADAAARLDMNQDASTATGSCRPRPTKRCRATSCSSPIARRHPNFARRVAGDSRASPRVGRSTARRDVRAPRPLRRQPRTLRVCSRHAGERVRGGARAIVDPELARRANGQLRRRSTSMPRTRASRATRRRARRDPRHRPRTGLRSSLYTVGRLQLQTLLAEYLLRTGERGSLRDFHDRLLSYGPVPFAVLDPELLADLDKATSVVRAAANY